jgi:hypothetical protein
VRCLRALRILRGSALGKPPPDAPLHREIKRSGRSVS